MPDAIITSTASTFGTISGTFAADQSTIVGTVAGSVVGTLTGSVGVPGPVGPAGPGSTWGGIVGTLSDQSDLWTQLGLKAPLASPVFTGNPTAPTAAIGDNDTSLATTAFVQQELLSGTANAKNLEVYVRNQTGSTLTAGTIVYINGATGNRPTVTKAQANNDANSAQTFGFVKTSIANNGFGFVIVRGELENVDTSALTEGVQLYLSPTTAGTWTTTKPSAPQHLVYVGICVRAHPTQGVILVAVQNGYELNELHDVQIVSPTNGQVLKYNSSTSLWYNGLDVGVPAGGSAGQFLQKIDGTDYNTDWVTVNLGAYAVKANNLSDLTNFSTARDNLGLGSLSNPTFAGVTVQGSGANVANLTPTSLSLTHATSGSFTIQPSVGITFPDATVQTTAFTGSAPAYITSVSSPLSVTSGNLTVDLSAYLTSATAASTYQTLSGMSSYLTTSAAASTYAPIASPTFTGLATFDNPGNYAISVPGSGTGFDVRIEGQVISMRTSGTEVIRIANNGIKYPDGVTQTVAFPGFTGYAPLASPALTGNVTITSNSSGAALFIEQSGTGNILTLHDQASDTTFVAIDQNGKVNTIPSTTASAGFNVPHGTAPTTPINGDLFTTTSGLFVRINGTTRQYVDFDGTQTINGAKTFSNANNTFGNSTAAGTTNIASGATISGSTKAVNLGTSGVAGSTTNIAIGSTTGTSTTTLQGTTNGVTAAADTNSVALATTAYVVGQAGSATPLVNGTAAVGTSLRYARQDHVHPTDTSRAPLASPAFTGTPSLPTGTTAVTQTAGNNTTAVATTAFVTAAVPAVATNAQALAQSSTSTVITPANAPFALSNGLTQRFDYLNISAISGSGAATTNISGYRQVFTTATGSAGRAAFLGGVFGSNLSLTQTLSQEGIINFSKKIWLSGRFVSNLNATYVGDANCNVSISVGGYSTNTTGNMTVKGIGLRKAGGASSLIQLVVHDGTTQTTVNTSKTVTTGEIVEYVIYSDGAGNVDLYINGTLGASSSAGPTGNSASYQTLYREQVEQTASATARMLLNSFGGQIIFER